MLRALGLLGLSCCVCAFLLAAAPFDRIPSDSPLHTNVQTYAEQGLLGDLLPKDELSRLEAALLVQRALEEYGARLLTGSPADTALESALNSDSSELAPELALIGGPAALPSTAPGSSNYPAAGSGAAETCPDCGEPVDQCAAAEEDECASPELNITPYGDLSLQLRAGRVAIATGGSLDTSDLSLYWGEVGVDIEHGQLSGHFSALLDTDEEDVALHEAYAEWRDEDNGWVLRGGRIVQPLGVRDTVFPSYSAASDLVYTTASAIGGTIRDGDASLTAYAFNPKVEVAGQNDTLSDYTVSLEVGNATDDAPDYYRLAAGMTSHVAASDIRLAGDGPLAERIGAGGLTGEYVWDCGRHRAVAEYSWAFDAFAAADLDIDGDGSGDKPSALNLEYIHTDSRGREFGLRHERTSEFADYAETRWGIMHGQRLNEFATFRVELSRGEFGDYSTVNAEHDTQLNAEVRIVF